MSALEYHRQELENRVNRFDGECDQAMKSINNLRIHARSFLETMPCDRTELKHRFLWCTRQLDEFMYLVTDFNLSVSKIAEEHDWSKTAVASKDPVLPTKNGDSENYVLRARNINVQKTQAPSSKQDQAKPLYQAKQAQNKQDSTENIIPKQGLGNVSKTGQPNWRERPQIIQEQKKNWREPQNVQVNQTGRASRRKKKSKEDLMQFSSVSCSVESFSEGNVVEAVTAKNEGNKESVAEWLALPPQPKLDAACVSACIASADAANLWLVTDIIALSMLTNEMTEYYNSHQLPMAEVPEFTCCAYFDEETKSYFRAIHIMTEDVGEIFLVDTGECRPVTSQLRPLAGRFCALPALAHCCHLADVNLPDDEELAEKQASFLSKHLWEEYRIELADQDKNTSESQGVYVYLDNGSSLNELLARELSNEPQLTEKSEPEEIEVDYQRGSQNLDLDAELEDDLDCGPEHENPLEAVTGYSNRDEMEICKHYKGGPDRTCFKGSRCKKRHVIQHPDGWTLDRVPVVTSCRPALLPAPGTACKVKVTHVKDAGCFFVQFQSKDAGMDLVELVEDMTRNAAKAKPLKILPALGELVSARFSDGRWYRARVTSCDEERGTVEVFYIDYGNESTVKLSQLAPLESRWLALPTAAARCRLAGVTVGTERSVIDVFMDMVLDLDLQARVVARSYDELTLELFDLEGFKVAEQLSIMADVPLQPYEVEDDTQRSSLHIPA